MSDLKDFVIENGVLKKYTGNDTQVIIPNIVATIGECAFAYCKSLTTITIPDSVTDIEGCAFFHCVKLNKISVPDSVKSIGKFAFSECSQLKTVSISAQTEVGECAFKGCKKLCNNQNMVIVNDVLYDFYGEDSDINIPESVQKISKQSFKDCHTIKSISFPQSLKCISDLSFENCKNLKCISFLSNDLQIGNDIFKECKNIVEIVLPQCVRKFENSVLEVIWKSVCNYNAKIYFIIALLKQYPQFANNAELQRIILSNAKRLIGISITKDDIELVDTICSMIEVFSLKEVNEYINKTSKSLQMNTFFLRYKNKHYTVEMQEEFETDNFEKEMGLKERTPADWKDIFSYKKTDKGIIITGYKGRDQYVLIPQTIGNDKVVEIGESAFNPWANKISKEIKNNRSNICSVIVPLGVKKIKKNAFYGCKKLKEIVLPESITNIGESAFDGCSLIEEIIIPNKVKSIVIRTFSGCQNLKKITLPKGITSFGYEAFYGCKNLGCFTINEGVTKIGEGCFSWCDNLNITIPNSVTDIDHYAFSHCENLTIHSPAGSYAEQYAKENNIPFVAE